MEKFNFYIVRISKLILTSPIWIPLLIIGSIPYIMGILGFFIEGLGKSIKSGGKSFDAFLVNSFAYDGSWCDNIAKWVNK